MVFFYIATMGWIYEISSLCKNSITYRATPGRLTFIAGVWVETITEGGWRFMAMLRKEEADSARHRQEEREANETKEAVIVNGRSV